jgi:hypothetical protein
LELRRFRLDDHRNRSTIALSDDDNDLSFACSFLGQAAIPPIGLPVFLFDVSAKVRAVNFDFA